MRLSTCCVSGEVSSVQHTLKEVLEFPSEGVVEKNEIKHAYNDVEHCIFKRSVFSWCSFIIITNI